MRWTIRPRICHAAVRHDFPINILFWGNLDAGKALIDRHPETRLVIDHMAIQQPSVPPEPWADLPMVLELANRKNVVIKVSGACTLSKQPCPFPDIWNSLPACSTPGVSIAACGKRTGRAPSWSSITSKPGHLTSSRPPAESPLSVRSADLRHGASNGQDAPIAAVRRRVDAMGPARQQPFANVARPDREPVVARADHGMIRAASRSQ